MYNTYEHVLRPTTLSFILKVLIREPYERILKLYGHMHTFNVNGRVRIVTTQISGI